jgi:hypothetical protein
MQKQQHTGSKTSANIQSYTSNAKRHHYVPEFLLRRFSTNPTEEHPSIWQFNVKTGIPLEISTTNCTVIGQYNRLSPASGLHPGFAEGMLSDIEGQSVPVIEKLLHSKMLNEPEREILSAFLMAQQQRTPRGREWSRFTQEQAATAWLLNQVNTNLDVTREHLREELKREPTEEEINTAIRDLAKPLERGELTVSASSDQEVLGMFVPAQDLIPLINDMNWTLLQAPNGSSFILSDEPLTRIDPLNPGGLAAWRSSPTVEATMPLDPQYCLRLRQPPRSQSTHMITAEEVLDINLRTYAGAREAIFGPTEALLESVNAAAKTNPIRIDLYQPKPPTVHTVEQVKGEDKPFKVTSTPGPTEIKIRRNR